MWSPFAAIGLGLRFRPVNGFLAIGILGLALHRISVEMGGGQLAASLRYLVAFLMVRLAALVNRLFVLGVHHRWQLTVADGRLADRYEANPEEEIQTLLDG